MELAPETDTQTSIERAIGLICGALAQAGIGLLMVFAAATVIDGITRWLLNWPLDIVRDIGGLWVAVGVSCCFPLAFLEGRNIVMDLVQGVVSATVNRVLDLMASLVVAGFLFLFALQFWRHAGNAIRAGETSMTLEIPTAPFWYAVDFNLWMTLLMQLIVVMRVLRSFRTRTDERRLS